ncbi:hypothetical protein QNJ28_00650 [Macrococcus caseolyticus]|uniref:hypothetical protein n=1 Tax=Macrococcoides caseolyticum TaxID=69966 RepID=UPI0024BD032E|nr:hypothetical protein [Macrococcus caseolyticus]MDJ1108595.1 hypothetical protein [Macrococcus caseolyticus]
MKKYRILVDFTDKYTGEEYKVGKIHEFSDERALEILSYKKVTAIEVVKTRTRKSTSKQEEDKDEPRED